MRYPIKNYDNENGWKKKIPISTILFFVSMRILHARGQNDGKKVNFKDLIITECVVEFIESNSLYVVVMFVVARTENSLGLENSWKIEMRTH